MQGFAELLDTAQSGAAPACATVEHSVRLFGVTLVGATSENGHKLVLTLAFIAIAWGIAWALRHLLALLVGSRTGTRIQFWAKQGVSLIVAAIVVLALAHLLAFGSILRHAQIAMLAIVLIAAVAILVHLGFGRWLLHRRNRSSS